MPRPTDIEITLSTWTPTWLSEPGVLQVASWYFSSPQGWRVSGIVDMDDQLLTAALGPVVSGEHAQRRNENSVRPASSTPVAYELNRFREGRKGPLEERIVEYAFSMIPCPVGLHSVDIRRPLKDYSPPSKWENSYTPAVIRDALHEIRALRDQLGLSWAFCSTFEGGYSVADLYHKRARGFSGVGFLYISKSVPIEDMTKTFGPAHVIDVGPGYEVALTRMFGGPLDTVPPAMDEGLWNLLRKASLVGLPWEVLRALNS